MSSDRKQPAADSTSESLARAKWAWACRSLDHHGAYSVVRDHVRPEVGDVAVVRVVSIRNHTRLFTGDEGRLRLYEGDTAVVVFGNRYATDAFEGIVDGVDPLHMLTGSGMVGTVKSRHRSIKPPTNLEFLGYLADERGHRINLRRSSWAGKVQPGGARVVLVIGTAMNAGKTTVVRLLTRSLLERGKRVAVFKLTGSVSPRDRTELVATHPEIVADFSDYGVPSTYMVSKEDLLGLFYSMLQDAHRKRPDIVVMEIADGLLQREVRMLLEDPAIRPHIGGVVLAASCAASALYCVDRTRAIGHKVIVVSGLLTSSALAMREFAEFGDVPIVSSAGRGEAMAEAVIDYLEAESLSRTGA